MKFLTLLALLAGSAAACSDERPASLPRLAAADTITVSGLSSGAYMAGQYHVAYSASVGGAALIAGGPWGCARGDVARALGTCMSGQDIVPRELEDLARSLAGAAQIDPLAGLADDRLFVFHGARDVVVADTLSDAAANGYRTLAPGMNIRTVKDIPVAHGWPTVATGQPCGEFAAPFIYACDYDLAGELLAHLLGELAAPAAAVGDLEAFSQTEFAGVGLADRGLVYVPDACRQAAGCRVHVFFHGCGQAYEQLGTGLAESAGLLRWAESNGLIVVFPQVAVSRLAPLNPLACWDWWGYSGESYLQQSASQLAAINAMVRRLQQPE